MIVKKKRDRKQFCDLFKLILILCFILILFSQEVFSEKLEPIPQRSSQEEERARTEYQTKIDPLVEEGSYIAGSLFYYTQQDMERYAQQDKSSGEKTYSAEFTPYFDQLQRMRAAAQSPVIRDDVRKAVKIEAERRGIQLTAIQTEDVINKAINQWEPDLGTTSLVFMAEAVPRAVAVAAGFGGGVTAASTTAQILIKVGTTTAKSTISKIVVAEAGQNVDVLQRMIWKGAEGDWTGVAIEAVAGAGGIIGGRALHALGEKVVSHGAKEVTKKVGKTLGKESSEVGYVVSEVVGPDGILREEVAETGSVLLSTGKEEAKILIKTYGEQVSELVLKKGFRKVVEKEAFGFIAAKSIEGQVEKSGHQILASHPKENEKLGESVHLEDSASLPLLATESCNPSLQVCPGANFEENTETGEQKYIYHSLQCNEPSNCPSMELIYSSDEESETQSQPKVTLKSPKKKETKVKIEDKDKDGIPDDIDQWNFGPDLEDDDNDGVANWEDPEPFGDQPQPICSS